MMAIMGGLGSLLRVESAMRDSMQIPFRATTADLELSTHVRCNSRTAVWALRGSVPKSMSCFGSTGSVRAVRPDCHVAGQED
jgi:hypothetical protein